MNSFKARFTITAVFCFTLLAQLSLVSFVYANNSNMNISTGYFYTTGKYNQSATTSIQYIPVTAQYYKNNWELGVTIPYIRVTGNGSVIPGDGGSMLVHRSGTMSGSNTMSMNNNSTTPGINSTTNAGLGDVLARMAYVISNKKNSYYALEANVKLGTADVNKSLGTGQNDYALQLNTKLGKTKNSYLNLGYKVIGNSSSSNYNNVMYGTVGIQFNLETQQTVGISYDYQQAVIDGIADFQQVNIYLNWLQHHGILVALTASAGLSTSSPDVGAGLMVSRQY